MSSPKPEIPREFFARLAYVVAYTRLDDKDFAASIGLGAGTFSRIGRGNVRLTRERADLIEREYGFRAEWLLHGKGSPRLAEGDTGVPLHESTPLPVVSAGKGAPREGMPGSDRIPIALVIFHCPRCRGDIRVNAEICPHCGLEGLLWPVPPSSKE